MQSSRAQCRASNHLIRSGTLQRQGNAGKLLLLASLACPREIYLHQWLQGKPSWARRLDGPADSTCAACSLDRTKMVPAYPRALQMGSIALNYRSRDCKLQQECFLCPDIMITHQQGGSVAYCQRQKNHVHAEPCATPLLPQQLC